jgi:acyl-CoA dehydrogenase
MFFVMARLDQSSHLGDEQMEEETDELQSFRRLVHDWLPENFPESLRNVDPLTFMGNARAAGSNADYQLWRERVADRGWGVPTWPRRFGGGDLTEAHARILTEEMARIGAFNPIRSYGTMMLGPTLLEFGNEQQKLKHLPPMARHEVRWCQGFSEPGAGSDLASLKTRCEDMGDHWLVNGQKIWTSGADQADWCFCLVRTDTSHKQRGISFLLIDMKSPGVEVRPIVLISGSTHFSEVFFTDVKVPKENLVGEINQGWTIAKRLLQFERDSISETRGEIPSLAPLAREHIGLDEQGRVNDPDLRIRLIRNGMRASAYGLTLARLAEERRGGNAPAPVSVIKNLWSSIAQERAELLTELLGAGGLGWGGEDYDKSALSATRAWLHSRAFSIYGGTFEIQNNVTAKRVLNLPDG